MKIITVVLTIVFIGGVLGYYNLPRHLAEQAEEANAQESEATDAPLLMELKMGAFLCANNRHQRDIHVTFELIGVIHPDQQFEISKLVHTVKKALVRQEVIRVIREASQEDLEDPELRKLKDQVAEAVNHALERKAIVEIVFNDYQMMRQ